MKLRVSFIFIAAVLISGCVGPFGRKTVWTPAEVAEWYGQWSLRPTVDRGIGYQGSDEAFHHFIARPIDYFVFIKVPRAQMQISDLRPKQQTSSDGLGIYYWVDPLNAFRKKEPDEAPKLKPEADL